MKLRQVGGMLLAATVGGMLPGLLAVRPSLLDVSLTTNGDVLVEVSDTGPGVAQEIESRLFVPFVTTKAEGMGIGLSISKRIVEAHGGAIKAYRNKRGGATFCFSLPTFRGSTVNA